MDGPFRDPSEFKVYWFSRDLVASRFGSYAIKEKTTLKRLSRRLGRMQESDSDLEEFKQYIEDTIRNSVSKIYGGDISKRYRQTEDLVERLLHRIENIGDIGDLRIAIDSVVRTSEILETTARFGAREIREIVDETLESSGGLNPRLAYEALYNVDFEGEAYQLGAQREPLIEYVTDLMEQLDREVHTEEVSRIVSAVVQEYERRTGQSRASTAGNVLETALQRVFDLFGIPATGVPERFGDLEIDNVVEGPDGSIGFSCKRTLRERFRQSLSRQAEVGVDEIWFVALMVADVSREKLRDILNDGGRIYVPRDSFVWQRYGGDDGLSYALRPADEFLQDVVEFTGVSSEPGID